MAGQGHCAGASDWLVNVGVDVDVTLDGGMKEEAGDSTGVPGSKLTFERLNSS